MKNNSFLKAEWKSGLKKIAPKPLLHSYQAIVRKEISALIPFLLRPLSSTTFRQRMSIIQKLYVISNSVPCPHTQNEVLSFITSILSIPDGIPGNIVECGAYKGGSSAKFSIAAAITSRRLIIFDSFEGLPPHSENHQINIFGEEADIPSGSYSGTLEEVSNTIEMYGDIGSCDFKKGWFKDTLPEFSSPIASVYLDVDLASSTKLCLKYLYPQLVKGGVLYSQDGHFPRVIDVFNDDRFWENEVGCPKPFIEGLGKKKLIKIVKSDI